MKDYINKIKDEEIKEKVKEAYNKLPAYFHKVAASSTGKYHPRFSLGEGGLLRHTKFAVDLALELFNIHDFKPIEQDVIIASLILHDGLKHGLNMSKYTVKDHADIMKDWLYGLWLKDKENTHVDLVSIVECIETHMGQWSINRVPTTELENFVHLCDYIASRKFIDNYYPEEKINE